MKIADMKKRITLITILIFSLLFSSCVAHYKDGREEKDFEKILASAGSVEPHSPEESFVELHSLDTYPSSGNKFYDAYVKRGTKTNYYLIRRMLFDEPTNFFIPDIATPLRDGDIAFMLLTDINCAEDGYEKNLFPSYVLEKEGYSAHYLFDYLHASESNRIEVARRLLEHYIDDETGHLHNYIERMSRKRFEELEQIFGRSKKLIENDADSQKLSDAIETIMRLSKLKKSDPDISWSYDLYTDGETRLEVVDGKGGRFKGAGSHTVDTGFYLHTADSHMNFFIADGGQSLVVDIGGGGDTESEYYMAQGGYDDVNYAPNRFYEINTKSGNVRIIDFYWD